MLTLADMTLAVVTTRTPNQQPTIKGQGHDLNLQGQVPPVVQGQAPARRAPDLGHDQETERRENILDLGQGNW